MLSMTGFGQGTAPLGEVTVCVDLRAVNHRFLDIRVKASSRFGMVQHVIERVIKQRLVRGHVDVHLTTQGSSIEIPSIDIKRATQAWKELEALRDEIAPNTPLPLELLASIPDLFVTPRTLKTDMLEQAVIQATAAACTALEDMRLTEGASLQTSLMADLQALQRGIAQVRIERDASVERHRHMLQERIQALLAPTYTLDKNRLEQEIAHLVQRSDIAEEITRALSHVDQLSQWMTPGTEAVGKRLDFLLQELAREVNTMGSKAQDAALARHVVDLKSLVERMREQVQNIV